MRMLTTIFSHVLSDKRKSCAWWGVTDRSKEEEGEEEVEAVCEPVPTCAENLDIDTSPALSVMFQSHNRKPLKLVEDYTCNSILTVSALASLRERSHCQVCSTHGVRSTTK
jgi:hypothetical protein